MADIFVNTPTPNGGYLPDATDFTDMAVKVRPDLRTDGARLPGTFVRCPKCKGYGGWNLRLNAFPPVYAQCTSEPPIPGHFQASCGQCWGWGWVEAASADVGCVHSFTEIAPDQPWRCWHTIRCTQCGRTRSYDSSD